MLRLPIANAPLKMVVAATIVLGLAAGCRSLPPKHAPVQLSGEEGREKSSGSHMDALVVTEAAHMAVEDQKRAEQGYEQAPTKVIPYRDSPIRPVRRR